MDRETNISLRRRLTAEVTVLRTNLKVGLRVTMAAASVTVLLSAYSCHSATESSEHDRIPISITAGMAEDVTPTRSMQIVTDATLEDYGLGLFASYSDEEITYPFTGIADNYISNAQGKKDNSTGGWVLTPECFWPMIGALSLFSYAPYNVNASTTQAVIPSASYVDGPLSIDYTPSSDNVSYQSDFCMSEPLFGRNYSDGPVQLRFRHTLCKVMFAVTYVNNNSASQTGTGLPPGLSLKIDKMTLSGIVGTNTVTYITDEPYFSWREIKDADVRDASYILYRGGQYSHLADATIPRTVSGDAERSEIFINGDANPNGRLLLIPQTVNPGDREDAVLSVDVALLLNAGTSSESAAGELTVTSVLPHDTEWPVGGTVVYHLAIDVSNFSNISIVYENVDGYSNWITPFTSSGNVFNGGEPFHID